jgi:anti-sigma regulatory factor (Ser/Thr protein kinase)
VSAELTLDPVPGAARKARRWVKRELAEGAHTRFTDAAVLGVSELVTNAVLHVHSPIVVRLVDDDDRLRVEVYDDSPRPPAGHPTFVPDGLHAPSTIGRGLQIVDSISHSWGVSYETIGKCIWFMPAPHGHDAHSGRSIPDLEPVEQGVVVDPTGRARVTLVDLPVLLFIHYRERFFDLQREMTLIALDARQGSQLAQRLVDSVERVQDFHLEATSVNAQLTVASEAGVDRADISLDVPRELAPVFVELRQLLVKANEFCREERLLTLEAGPQEQALRAWYLSELAAQIDGAVPIAWPGLFVVTDPTQVDLRLFPRGGNS